MTNFLLMFDSREGGDTVPIQWNRENLTNDKSIIILDETNQVLWLWHGTQQGLVARRTALRQAESLKGHGYTVGKSIIGRDIREILEIDQRKIGRVPETDELNNNLESILNKNFKELDNFVITFSETARLVASSPASKPAAAPSAEPAAAALPKPVVKIQEKAAPAVAPAAAKPAEETPMEEARISFILKATLDQFDDIWISKKKDGSYAVEMLDGPVCGFSIKEGGTIKFSANSFTSVGANMKTDIQKKYVDLSKLLK